MNTIGMMLVALVILGELVNQLRKRVVEPLVTGLLAKTSLPVAPESVCDVLVLGLGVGGAFAFQFNMFAALGLFADAPLAWLIVGTGIAIGFGSDFALGLAKLGGAGVQVVQGVGEAVTERARIAAATKALYSHESRGGTG